MAATATEPIEYRAHVTSRPFSLLKSREYALKLFIRQLAQLETTRLPEGENDYVVMRWASALPRGLYDLELQLQGCLTSTNTGPRCRAPRETSINIHQHPPRPSGVSDRSQASRHWLPG